MIWACRICCWGARIIQHESGLGPRWVCMNCGCNGCMSDDDAPIEVTEDEANLYWYELQNDPIFLPPRLQP